MDFFVLDRTTDRLPFETEYLTTDDTRYGDAPRCPACGKFVGMLEWLPPFRVELEAWGKAFGDLALCAGREILVSERFRSLWHEHGLTGLSGFEPVSVVKLKRRRAKADPPRYHHAAVGRTMAAIDAERSGLETDPPVCPQCRLGRRLKRCRRVVIEEGTWTSEDLFVARGIPGMVIASQRFKDFCDQFTIANAPLVPAESFSFDYT